MFTLLSYPLGKRFVLLVEIRYDTVPVLHGEVDELIVIFESLLVGFGWRVVLFLIDSSFVWQ
jgi:hypothetical protein